MAIAYRSGSRTISGAASITGTEPSGATSGDVIIAVILNNGTTVPLPTGWTDLFNGSLTGVSTIRYRACYIVRSGSAPSYASAGAGGTYGEMRIGCWSGVDNTTPINISGQTATNLSGTQPNPPSITTTVANTVNVVLGISWAGWSAGAPAPPTGYTARNGTFVANDDTVMAEKALAAIGAEDAGTWGAAGSSESVWAAAIALAPSGGTAASIMPSHSGGVRNRRGPVNFPRTISRAHEANFLAPQFANVITSNQGTATADGLTATPVIVVTGTVGTATADAPTPVEQITHIATVGAATAVGLPASLLDVTTQATVGTATADGKSATPTIVVTATTGTATAAGLSASIVDTASVTTGTATASGLTPSLVTVESATTGTATAAGLTAQGVASTIVVATTATATADGKTPTEVVVHTGTVGNATASGQTPTVLIVHTATTATATASGLSGAEIIVQAATLATATAAGLDAQFSNPTGGSSPQTHLPVNGIQVHYRTHGKIATRQTRGIFLHVRRTKGKAMSTRTTRGKIVAYRTGSKVARRTTDTKTTTRTTRVIGNG